MNVKKINNVEIKPIQVEKVEKKDILGSELFDEIYANIFICAKKKSGKSTVIYNIIKKCCDKRTKVIVFCSTYLKDANWKEIQTYLEKKEIENEFYLSIYDEKKNVLQELVDTMQTEEEEEEIIKAQEEEEQEDRVILINDSEIRVSVKKRKPKKLSQRYMIIFDDLSQDLKDPSVSHLLKKNRHMKSKIIISSQYLNDIPPMSRRQIDVYLIFSGLNLEKLQEIYKNADLDLSFERFIDLYHDATSEKYQFFYVDASNCNYRRCFNYQYII